MLAALSKQTGVSAAWGRLFFLYGQHEYAERLVASVIRALLQEQPALCSHGRQIRDFLYVQDAADALVALLDSNVEGAINIASGIPVSVADVVEQLAELMQHPELVRLGALPETGDDPHLLVADTTRVRNVLGWSPRYQLSDGLSQTIRWWKLRK
jgi:nucleoside-diphosphate-sugar epimerase